jgi:transposase-like protein
MRYAQGGGLTAEGRRRRDQVRLAAAERFGQRVPAADIAAELQVTERSVRRWRHAREDGGSRPAGAVTRTAGCWPRDCRTASEQDGTAVDGEHGASDEAVVHQVEVGGGDVA